MTDLDIRTMVARGLYASPASDHLRRTAPQIMSMCEKAADAMLAAVTPVIAAQVRESVARDLLAERDQRASAEGRIRDKARALPADSPRRANLRRYADNESAWAEALDHAARIAREGK